MKVYRNTIRFDSKLGYDFVSTFFCFYVSFLSCTIFNFNFINIKSQNQYKKNMKFEFLFSGAERRFTGSIFKNKKTQNTYLVANTKINIFSKIVN